MHANSFGVFNGLCASVSFQFALNIPRSEHFNYVRPIKLILI